MYIILNSNGSIGIDLLFTTEQKAVSFFKLYAYNHKQSRCILDNEEGLILFNEDIIDINDVKYSHKEFDSSKEYKMEFMTVHQINVQS